MTTTVALTPTTDAQIVITGGDDGAFEYRCAALRLTSTLESVIGSPAGMGATQSDAMFALADRLDELSRAVQAAAETNNDASPS